jgi:hypothetical protein
MNTDLPEGITLDDIVPEDLRVRADDLTAALDAVLIQLRPLIDLADELLAQYDQHLEVADEQHGHLGALFMDDLAIAVGQRELYASVGTIHDITDYEAMHRSWPHRKALLERLKAEAAASGRSARTEEKGS